MDITQAPRRVVTGHDSAGRSCIALDDRPGAVPVGEGADRRDVTELWATVSHGAGGASEFRVVDLPAGAERVMHRTDTVDYGLVLAGEVYLVLETEETQLRPGDVVVQRGTRHAWHNRSDQPARMAFVNLSGPATDEDRCPKI